MGDAAAFGHEALGEVLRRGLPHATDVVSVNDGAAWIQGFVDLHCPQARRVLDFAHAAGYLATAATEAFGEGTAAMQTWFATQRHALRYGEPAALPAGAERDRSWEYLAARRSQIAYRDFTARGWPIGSGCVESSHKGIVQARLKQRGMRWARGSAEAMLTLRVAAANERWDAAWAPVGARRHRPRTKLVANGKPTADHPRRRFRLNGSRPLHHRM